MGGNETSPQPQPWSLHLRLQVFAVILTLSLSKGKIPKNSTHHPGWDLLPRLFPLCICLSFINEANEPIHIDKVQLN
jgi:hypothetical protein